jgi:hypothetical protein
MTGWETLISSLGLSFASGVNLYATILVVGLAQRYGFIENLPGPLHAFSNPWILGIAGALYAVEFLVDKFPFVATVWDAVHTLIRPLGGALIALAAAHEMSPLGQAAAMLVGGSVAFGTHSTKAGFRMLANTAPEPVTHSAISVAEDVGVFGLALLALTYPWLALGLMIACVAIFAYLAPTIWRTLRFLLSCTWGWLAAVLGILPQHAREAPQWLNDQLLKGRFATADLRIYRAFARTNAGGPRYGIGFLALAGEDVLFAREGMFRNTLQRLGSAEMLTLVPGAVCDTVVSQDGRTSVCLAKHWAQLYRTDFHGTPNRGAAESA